MPISGLTFAQKKESEVLAYLQTELASGRFLASDGLGFSGLLDAGFKVTRGVGTYASVEQDRQFNLMTRADTANVPSSVSVYFSQTAAQLAAALSAEATAGRELVAIHAEANKFGQPSYDLVFYGFLSKSRLRHLVVPIVAAGIESTGTQDTGVVIPENSIVTKFPFLITVTPEATGGTKEIDVGYVADPDAFGDGVDVSIGGTQLLEDASGIPLRVADVDAGDNNIAFVLGSDDWVEYVGLFCLDLLLFE